MQEKTKYFKMPGSDKVIAAPDFTATVYIRNGFVEVDAKGRPIAAPAAEAQEKPESGETPAAGGKAGKKADSDGKAGKDDDSAGKDSKKADSGGEAGK